VLPVFHLTGVQPGPDLEPKVPYGVAKVGGAPGWAATSASSAPGGSTRCRRPRSTSKDESQHHDRHDHLDRRSDAPDAPAGVAGRRPGWSAPPRQLAGRAEQAVKCRRAGRDHWPEFFAVHHFGGPGAGVPGDAGDLRGR